MKYAEWKEKTSRGKIKNEWQTMKKNKTIKPFNFELKQNTTGDGNGNDRDDHDLSARNRA